MKYTIQYTKKYTIDFEIDVNPLYTKFKKPRHFVVFYNRNYTSYIIVMCPTPITSSRKKPQIWGFFHLAVHAKVHF